MSSGGRWFRIMLLSEPTHSITTTTTTTSCLGMWLTMLQWSYSCLDWVTHKVFERDLPAQLVVCDYWLLIGYMADSRHRALMFYNIVMHCLPGPVYDWLPHYWFQRCNCLLMWLSPSPVDSDVVCVGLLDQMWWSFVQYSMLCKICCKCAWWMCLLAVVGVFALCCDRSYCVWICEYDLSLRDYWNV